MKKNKNIITLAIITIIVIIVFMLICHVNNKTKVTCIDIYTQIDDVLSKYGELKYNDKSGRLELEGNEETIIIDFKKRWFQFSWFKWNIKDNYENPYNNSELQDICKLFNILSDSESDITNEDIIEFLKAPEDKYALEKYYHQKSTNEIYAKVKYFNFWQHEYLRYRVFDHSENNIKDYDISFYIIGDLKKCK